MRKALTATPIVLATLIVAAHPALAASPTSVLPSGTSVATALSQSPQLSLLAVLVLLAALPGIVLLMTSFTRIVVVLSLVRTALGLNQVPPNQVLVGLAIFLTLFAMGPTLAQVESHAVTPYLSGRITASQAATAAQTPLRTFLAHGTRSSDLQMFYSLEGKTEPAKIDRVPLTTLVPAYTISQLTIAFEIGVLLFIPFVIIDFIVASVLMALGMMMVPPTLISLPIKLLLFVLMNGWALVVQSALVVR